MNISGRYDCFADRGDMCATACSGWLSLVSGLSPVNLIQSRDPVGAVESILKAYCSSWWLAWGETSGGDTDRARCD